MRNASCQTQLVTIDRSDSAAPGMHCPQRHVRVGDQAQASANGIGLVSASPCICRRSEITRLKQGA